MPFAAVDAVQTSFRSFIAEGWKTGNLNRPSHFRLPAVCRK
jgi:hypothetical protein